MGKKLIWLFTILFLIGCGSAAENDNTLQEAPDLVQPVEDATPRPVDPEQTIVPDADSGNGIIQLETPIVVEPGEKRVTPLPENVEEMDMETIDDVREALSAQLEVPLETVTTVVAEEVTWPDGAIGCPQPGMNYIQVLTPGRRLVLEVDGVQYHYHARATGPYQYCAAPQSPAPGGSSQEGGGVNQTSPYGQDD